MWDLKNSKLLFPLFHHILFPDSYANNPQYGSFFTVTEASVEQDGKCTVIVAVLQKYRRELRAVGKDSLPIGFAVYQVDRGTYGALPPDFFQSRKPVAKTKVFINMREVGYFKILLH